MARHPTISDKGRSVNLIIDGQWHPLTIRDRDGVIKESVAPDLPGVYLVLCQLNGKIGMLADGKTPDIPASNIEVRGQRYPDDEEGSTAWDQIDVHHTVAKGRWYGSRPKFKFIAAAGAEAGIDYRVRKGPGKLTVESRTIKFLFIASDVTIL